MSSSPKQKKLLFTVSIADCEIQTFTVGGPGGGGKDTSNSGVRLIHRPSGAVGTGREERSLQQNKVKAFRRMAETKEFKAWHMLTVAKLQGKPTVDELVEAWMHPKNLVIETRVEDKWVPYVE
jgi:hypothetical protein